MDQSVEALLDKLEEAIEDRKYVMLIAAPQVNEQSKEGIIRRLNNNNTTIKTIREEIIRRCCY